MFAEPKEGEESTKFIEVLKKHGVTKITIDLQANTLDLDCLSYETHEMLHDNMQSLISEINGLNPSHYQNYKDKRLSFNLSINFVGMYIQDITGVQLDPDIFVKGYRVRGAQIVKPKFTAGFNNGFIEATVKEIDDVVIHNGGNYYVKKEK